MRTEGQRRSDNFEDRGRGGGGMGGGGLPGGALFAILRRIGIRGILIVAVIGGVIWFAFPQFRAPILQLLGISGGGGQVAQGEGSVCESNAQACDFSRAVLGSTEDVWAAQFQQGRLPSYGQQAGAYQNPTLVVFSGGVSTEGCGNASSDVGPFYCPTDRKLYIDPGFYQVMESRLRAPGDFAQAYVIAHEVGHHVQNLIGSTQNPGARREPESNIGPRGVAGRLSRRRVGAHRAFDACHRRRRLARGAQRRARHRRRYARPARRAPIHARHQRPAHDLVPPWLQQRRCTSVRHIQRAGGAVVRTPRPPWARWPRTKFADGVGGRAYVGV